MTYWREAATLILALQPRLASHAQKGAKRASDFKMLMLKRSDKSSFMPARLVFPGGMLQEVDYSNEWAGLYKTVTGKSFETLTKDFNQSLLPMYKVNRDWPVPAAVAFRICAIRETFEESGLLLVTKQNDGLPAASQCSAVTRSAKSLTLAGDEWRKKVEKNPMEFLSLCSKLGVVPDIWALHDWRNWLTPVFKTVASPPAKPARFDTAFYMCCIDCDEVPHTLADESETMQAQVCYLLVFLR